MNARAGAANQLALAVSLASRASLSSANSVATYEQARQFTQALQWTATEANPGLMKERSKQNNHSGIIRAIIKPTVIITNIRRTITNKNMSKN